MNTKKPITHNLWRWLKKGLLVCWFSLMMAWPIKAESPAFLPLTADQASYTLGGQVAILLDPSRQLTIEQIITPNYQAQFQPTEADVPNFGFTSAAIWVRGKVVNHDKTNTVWLLQLSDPTLDAVEFYIAPATIPVPFLQEKTGDLEPISSRHYYHHHFVFRVTLEPETPYIFYFRLQNHGSTPLPLTLWTLEAFAHENYTQQFVLGFYYGLIFIMICYNFFLFMFLREVVYLYYVLTILAVGIYQMSLDGVARLLLWPNQIWWGDISVVVSVSFALTMSLNFTLHFLPLQEHKLGFFLKLLRNIGWVLVVCAFWPSVYRWVGQGIGLLTLSLAPASIFAGAFAWRNGYLPARYYLLAWGGLGVAAVIAALTLLGVLPINPLTQYSVNIGIFLLILLLSVALADRINLLKAETELANSRLKHNEHRLTQFLEAIPLGVIVLDPSQQPSYANQHARNMFSEVSPNSPPPLYVATTHELYPPEQHPQVRALQGESVNIDSLVVEINQMLVPIEVWATPIFDEHHQIIYALVVLRDITQRRQIETDLARYRHQLEDLVAERTAELAQVNQALQLDIHQRQLAELKLTQSLEHVQKSEQLLEAIINTSPDWIYLKDIEFKLLLANRRMAEDLGWSVEEMIGRDELQLGLPPELILGSPEQGLRGSRSEDELVLMGESRHISENPKLLKDGTLHVFDTYKLPLKDKDGQVYAILVFAHDITERQKTEATLQEAKENAEVANRAKTAFLTSMSHELRTPLNGILGYTQILSWDENLTAEQREAIGIIQQSGEHLLTLLNDILDLSKIEAGRIELSIQEFNLPKFIQNLVDIFHVRAHEKELQFVYQPLGDLPHSVKGDERRLRQILINLLGNAIKFTTEGQVCLKVGYHEGNIRFQVEDTGCGIEAAHLADIFLPFHQIGHPLRKSDGTGLGLAISHKLVEIMGGKLGVESVYGQGSIFWLDVALPATEDWLAVNPVRTQPIVGYAGPRRKILVADDTLINRAMLVNLLRPLGFEVVEANNGQEAVTQSLLHQPDLIFMDLVMPKLDGWEATAQIRQTDDLLFYPIIIAVSASAFTEDETNSLVSGCNDFMGKPFQRDIVLQKLQTHLQLEWLYQTETLQVMPLENLPIDSSLPPERLWQLYDLIVRGRIKDVQDKVGQMEAAGEYPLFVATLKPLAQNYRLTEINHLIEFYLSQLEK